MNPVKWLLLPATLVSALAACSDDAESAACRANLECRAQSFIEQADVSCKEPVEKLLGPGMSWDQTRERELVSSYRWKDQARGTVAYFGDKALVQTPHGAERVHYECDVDPDNRAAPVFGVRTATGGL
jgi:hypothetical protein